MSDTARPRSTEAADIGIERNRSVTPLSASWVTAIIVSPVPNAIVITNMPGIRNSM